MIPCKTVILIMGLSGSGKTTFYNSIKNHLKEHDYFNADVVRSRCNDWDFSIGGRIRQAARMSNLAEMSKNDLVIIDMICPLISMRKLIKPDIIFFINRTKDSQYKDTDKLFEIPYKTESSLFCIIE
jgi:adenylylsulfate kinase-like enzyme